ncbi:MAG: hypothetical protein B6U89_04195 [Desulfurococcales archaeon ex4484_58]|nr:MAG: hypothetical protein B6U89_04195 [Desulfurococcales archaeon ex4484_58]
MLIDKKVLEYYLKLREIDHPVGVREAQRILGFNSPGKSQRLLRKLVRLGLAYRNEEGKYVIVKDPPLELVGRVFIKGRLLPKMLVIAVYTSTLSITYALLAKPPLDILLLLLLLNTPLWIEALIEYRELKRKW